MNPFLLFSTSFSISHQNESGGLGEDEKEAVVNIDTAISSDHARIEMDHANGKNLSRILKYVS